MMKAAKLLAVAVIALPLAACLQTVYKGEPVDPAGAESTVRPAGEADERRPSSELVVWSYFDMTETNKAFRAVRPDVELRTETFGYEQFPELSLSALAGDDAPDVLILDNGFLGKFNTLRVFENLADERYAGEAYMSRVPENYRSRYMTFGTDEWFAMPLELPVAVTFYRQDLFEANGLPSEPEEVAEALASGERWLEAARKLADSGVFLFQFDSDPLEIAGWSKGYVDERLLFARNDETTASAIRLSRRIADERLSLRASVWSDAGQEALRDGKLAMVHLGSWGISTLQSWVPGQAGLWRATRLPLGLHGTAGGSAAAIPSDSPNKDLAWEYIRAIASPLELPAWQDGTAFLGGQTVSGIVKDSRDKMAAMQPSPFDEAYADQWAHFMTTAVASDERPENLLDTLAKAMDDLFKQRREAILEAVGPSE